MKTNVIVIGILFLFLAILQLIGGVFVITGSGMAAVASEEASAKAAELRTSHFAKVAEFEAELQQTDVLPESFPGTADADEVASLVDGDELAGQAEASMVEMGGSFSKMVAALGAVLGGALLVFGVLGLITGIGVLKNRGWGRILAIILAIPALLGFPIGTIFGIYVLIIMLNSGTKALFSGAGVPVAEAV